MSVCAAQFLILSIVQVSETYDYHIYYIHIKSTPHALQCIIRILERHLVCVHVCADRLSHEKRRDQNKIEIRLQKRKKKTQNTCELIANDFIEVLIAFDWNPNQNRTEPKKREKVWIRKLTERRKEKKNLKISCHELSFILISFSHCKCGYVCVYSFISKVLT